LNERKTIAIAVLSEREEDVEFVNGTLRDAGHATQCHWVENPAQFDEALDEDGIELIILNDDHYPDAIRQVIKQKDTFFPEVHERRRLRSRVHRK